MKVKRIAKLWEKIKEGETEADRSGYRGLEIAQFEVVQTTDDECPEVVVYYFADKAHDDPESTLATRGVDFWTTSVLTERESSNLGWTFSQGILTTPLMGWGRRRSCTSTA